MTFTQLMDMLHECTSGKLAFMLAGSSGSVSSGLTYSQEASPSLQCGLAITCLSRCHAELVSSTAWAIYNDSTDAEATCYVGFQGTQLMTNMKQVNTSVTTT